MTQQSNEHTMRYLASQAAPELVTCCDRMKKLVQDRFLEIGADGSVNITGCCQSCYVASEVKFCPWCAVEITVRKAPTK